MLEQLTRATSPREKGSRLERSIHQRAARRTDGDAKDDTRVGDPLDGGEPRLELLAYGVVDDDRRQVELVHEHFAVKLLRRERAKERAPNDLVVHGRRAAKHLGERRARPVVLDRHDEPAREVHAMRPPAILDELERSGRRGPMKRTQQIAERGRA